MADLTDEELASLRRTAGRGAFTAAELESAVAELQRRRAEQAAAGAPIRFACEQAIDGALGELDRQAGGQLDPRMLKEARGAGLLAVAHLITGCEHVERVVVEAIDDAMAEPGLGRRAVTGPFVDFIARRVADRLSAPVLSADEVDALRAWRSRNMPWAVPRSDDDHRRNAMCRALDRLIAGAKPDAEPVDWSSRLRACADQLSKLAETYIIEHGQVLLRSSIKAKP